MAVEWYPLRFEPIFKGALWGGHSLRPLLGRPASAEPEGEAWLVSDQGDNCSRVAAGELKGCTLRDLMSDHSPALLGDAAAPAGRFPLLLKLLEAREPLSVQVHPSDAQARQLDPAGAGIGKTEAWVVLTAEPGSLFYAGFREGATFAELEHALHAGTLPDILHSFSPSPGDCVFLEAGTVHAIGGGLTLFEVQQTSDITYRLFDWGRVDGKTGRPRQLHIESALVCADVSRGPCRPVTPSRPRGSDRERLVSCPFFTLERVRSARPFNVGAPRACRLVVCIEGRAEVEYRGTPHSLRPGDVLLLPAAIGACLCVPDGPTTVLECCIP